MALANWSPEAVEQDRRMRSAWEGLDAKLYPFGYNRRGYSTPTVYATDLDDPTVRLQQAEVDLGRARLAHDLAFVSIALGELLAVDEGLGDLYRQAFAALTVFARQADTAAKETDGQ